MSDPFDLSDIEPAAPAYLDALNPAQREAVEAVSGPVLVLAGAGTGKTRVLTTRLAHILDSGLAHPGETLTVTFTNKAAREMKDRVEGLLGRSVEGWFLGTFHAMAARILRRHAEIVGLKSDFTIIDADDQHRAAFRAHQKRQRRKSGAERQQACRSLSASGDDGRDPEEIERQMRHIAQHVAAELARVGQDREQRRRDKAAAAIVEMPREPIHAADGRQASRDRRQPPGQNPGRVSVCDETPDALMKQQYQSGKSWMLVVIPHCRQRLHREPLRVFNEESAIDRNGDRTHSEIAA